jgi:hypothetical protein
MWVVFCGGRSFCVWLLKIKAFLRKLSFVFLWDFKVGKFCCNNYVLFIEEKTKK